MFEAKIIAHSRNEEGKELTTMQLCYPRFIHGELMTHRVFSRNAMSSRAVPIKVVIEQVKTNPAMPVYWGKNKSGMQALEEVDTEQAKFMWQKASELAALSASLLDNLNLHKQIANRVLEPFQWMHTIVTSTEWDNFYELRDHADAQPEFAYLARIMREAHKASTPKLLLAGEWHLPYITEDDLAKGLDVQTLCRISAARCARVSYLTHDGKVPSIEADLRLFDMLASSRPLHASPLEHQGTPGLTHTGNFKGFTQFRKLWEELV